MTLEVTRATLYPEVARQLRLGEQPIPRGETASPDVIPDELGNLRVQGNRFKPGYYCPVSTAGCAKGPLLGSFASLASWEMSVTMVIRFIK